MHISFQFKKFNRFNRPDHRSSLLQKILNKGTKSENVLTPEEQEELKEKQQQEESQSVKQNLVVFFGFNILIPRLPIFIFRET